MPIKAPCQPGQGPEIEINPKIFLESSCLEFVEGHEQMEEYLTEMVKEGGCTSLDLTTMPIPNFLTMVYRNTN